MPDQKVSLKDIYDSVQELRHEIQENYVTKDEFTPVKSLVYGLVTLILLTVATAIVAQVVKAI